MNSPRFSRLTPEQRREQILAAAHTLFAERPYDEVSVEDIASAAGVTRGLVHHYFGGRKDVFIGWRLSHKLRALEKSTTAARAALFYPRRHAVSAARLRPAPCARWTIRQRTAAAADLCDSLHATGHCGIC